MLGSRQRLYILLLIRFIRIDAFFNGDRINVGRFSLIEALIINTKKDSIIHHVVSKIHFLFLLHKFLYAFFWNDFNIKSSNYLVF